MAPCRAQPSGTVHIERVPPSPAPRVASVALAKQGIVAVGGVQTFESLVTPAAAKCQNRKLSRRKLICFWPSAGPMWRLLTRQEDNVANLTAGVDEPSQALVIDVG